MEKKYCSRDMDVCLLEWKLSTLPFLLVWILICTSCHYKENTTTFSEITTISLYAGKGQVLNLSEFAESVEFIPLETRDDNLLGWIPRIIATSDRYYVSSAIGYSNRKLLVFDKQGKFIRQIGKEGQGPEEYIEMMDFSLVNDSVIKISEVYNMVSFDLEGNFIGKEKQEETPLEIYSLKGKTFASAFLPNRCGNHLLRVLDANDKFLRYALKVSPIEAEISGDFVPDAGFTSDENNIFYTFPFSPIIYRLNVETLESEPFYRIDYGKRNASWQIFRDSNRREWRKKQKQNNEYMAISGIFNIGNKLIVNSVDDDFLFYFGIYSKETGKVLCGQRIKDDMFFKGNQMNLKAYMLPYYGDGEYLLWPVKPKFLLNGYNAYRLALGENKWRKFCRKYPRLIEVCEQLNEESNPVLMKIKLKEF